MKKRKILMTILAAALCLLVTAAAASCGKKGPEVTDTPADPTETAAEISSEISQTLPETTESEMLPAETESTSAVGTESSAEDIGEESTDGESTPEESEESTGPETEESTAPETPAETKPPAKNGFIVENGNTYYYRNGVRQTGFQFVGGKRYYFQSNGVMLRNTVYGRYSIDANGVCTDRFGTITSSNLAAYVDFLLDQNGRTLKGAFNYIWKNYTYRYAPRIGTLAGLTESNRIAMICRFMNNGVGPCTDFAYTLQYFCERLGYQAKVVTGEGMNHDEHDWVLVQVSAGTWRHMDALYKTQYFYLLTDDQLARFDGNDYRFRWDRTKWTSTTATGTGGKNPETQPESTEPESSEAPATTAAEQTQPETTAETSAEATTAAPPETTPPETTPEAATAAPTTEAPPEPTTEEATTAPETTVTPTTTEAPTTEAPTEPAPTDAPEVPGAADSGEGLTAGF